MAKQVIGIDLGTTFSVAAYVPLSGEPVVIPDSQGRMLLPSVISVTGDGKLLVGEEARRQRVARPVLTISSVKRLMGKGSREINPGTDYIPYPLDLTDEKIVRIRLGDKWWTPPEISALILRRLKEQAELFLHEPVEAAVITVPAYFNDSQRQATKDAGRIAGLQVLRIVNEPTAASLAYGLQKKDRGKIAVYDFGGGTFDISILNVRGGIFEVLSTSGDTHLGGDDIDWKIAQTLIGEIEAGGNKISGDLELVQMIVEAAERAKIELSDKTKTEIILSNKRKNFSFKRTLERSEFEALIRPIIEKTIGPCRRAMKDEKLSGGEINEVVLVGGSTRIPLAREIVRSIFQKEPHCELNPDEVVALGAAVQAHILMGERKDMLLLDVTPLSLGIETYGGAVAKIIERNSTIPARASEVFTTFVDGQTSVDIHILQGERELVADCRSLARFQLQGIAPMPAGTPRIEVTFLIDENGILQVKARDQRGNREQSIEVKPSYGLNEESVKTLVREAFAHAKEDFDAHILVDVKNESAIMIRATEKALKEKGPQLSAEEKKEIETALDQLKALVKETDHRKIREAIDVLNKKTQRLAETMLNDAVKQTLIGKKVV